MKSLQAASSAKLIAVIDDDPLVLEAIGGLLRNWGYQVLTAATDRSALGELAERGRPPDLIVCDYHLSGGVKGVEAIERLRDAFRIPAFLLTSDAAAAELAQTGALDIQVLRKPADPKILRANLRQALDGRGRCGPRRGSDVEREPLTGWKARGSQSRHIGSVRGEHRPPRTCEEFCAKCDADHMLVAAMRVRTFPMTRIGEVPMATNMDVALAVGFVALVLICLVAEGFYFLQLPIWH